MYLEERLEAMEKIIENLQQEIRSLEAKSADEILTSH
jgi:prefoldin subunit 5